MSELAKIKAENTWSQWLHSSGNSLLNNASSYLDDILFDSVIILGARAFNKITHFENNIVVNTYAKIIEVKMAVSIPIAALGIISHSAGYIGDAVGYFTLEHF